MRQRLLSHVLPAVVIAACVAVVSVLAVISKGFPTTRAELHDSGIWVSNDLAHSYGRVNKSARGLDAYLDPPGASGSSPLDVAQDAAAVVEIDPTSALLIPVDSMAVTNQADNGVQLAPGSQFDLRGGTAAAIDPAGRIFAVRYDPEQRTLDLSGLDPNTKPIAELGPAPAGVPAPVAIAVGVDGTIHAASVNGKTATIVADGPVFKPAVIGQITMPLQSLQVAAVGSRAVLWDGTTGTLVLPDGRSKALTADPAALVQQSGPDTAFALLGTSTGLLSIGLDDGVAATIAEVPGNPAAPVRLGGCSFGAWAGSGGGAIRSCDGGSVEQMQVVSKGEPLSRPAFRVNRNAIVLNDSADGRIFDLDAQVRLDDWDAIRPPKQTDPNDADPKKQEPDVRESKPKANNDDVGARPGRTTVAYVLDNDTDSASGILMVTKVAGVPDAVRANVAPDGQTITLDVPAGQRPFSFGYTITNGYNSSSATVSVKIRRQDENGTPTLRDGFTQPDYSVASFGTLAMPITADWRDPDGDPVTLVGAEIDSEDALAITPDGRVEITALGTTREARRKISYRVTDGGTGQATSSLKVKVLSSNSIVGAAPVARPDAVKASARQPATFFPLANDLPGSDPRNPQARLTLGDSLAPQSGLRVQTDQTSGRVSVTAAKAGTYFLDYTATFGSSRVSKSRIRVEVERDSASVKPVAMPDQAAIRGRGSILIDVLGNDYDPLGGLLTVQDASPADSDQLGVSIVSGRWLLVTALHSSVSPNPQAVRYTVTNGRESASGDALVTVLEPLSRDEALVRDDLAIVRADDSVLINALSNDAASSGKPLTLVTNVEGQEAGTLKIIDPSKAADADPGDIGQAFVFGDRIRYVAPRKVTQTRQFQITYTARTEDGQTGVGHVTVTVKPQPASSDDDRAPAPQAVDLRLTAGDRAVIPMPISGQDPDGDSVTVVGIDSAPTKGRVTGFSPAGVTYEAFPNEDAIGTDTFTVLVADRYGKTGAATVRVAIVDPGQTQPPVARDDLVIASPEATVRVDVRKNDIIGATDRVGIEPLDDTNDQLPAGVSLDSRVGPVTVQAPAANGQPVFVDYQLQGNGGKSDPATIRVVSQEGYKIPPVVKDLVAEAGATAGTATVNLLEGAWDPDGKDEALTATLLLAPEGVTLSGSKATIPMADHPQVLAYRVTDASGASTAAILFVPSAGVGAPYLKQDGRIELAPDTSLTASLGDYVLSPRQQPIRFTDAAPVVSSPSQVKVERVDATRFTVTATSGYTGPAAVTMEVMDGASVTEPGIARGFVTIPIQVGPKTPVLRCPSSVQTLMAGGRAKTLDLTSLCHAWAPDPAMLDTLEYTADWAQQVANVDVTVAHELRLQALGSAVPGSTGELTIGVKGLPTKPQSLRVRVLAAPPPTMSGRTFTDVLQGTPVRIPLGISSPLADAQPGIVKVDQTSGPQASVSQNGAVLTITPGGGVDGTMTFVVTATDVADKGRQDRWVSATFTLKVYGVPGAPGAPQPGKRAQSHAETLTWSAAEANGAAVTKYEVKSSKGLTQTCPSTSCQITGLDNNVPVTFQVRAFNKAGPGPWSKQSRSVTPDQPPPAVTGLTVSDPLDGRLTLSWTKVVVDGSPVKFYRIVVGGREFTADGAATSKVLTGLDNNTRYTISIAAKNNYDFGPTSTIQGQSAGKPLGLNPPSITPTDLVGANTSVRIAWNTPNKNGPSDLTYSVVRSGGKAICTGVSGTSCVDDVVAFDGKTYTYTVTATNGAGGALHSSSASATWQATGTPGTPGAPSAVATGTDQRIRVSGAVPDSRGSASTVRIFANGTQVDSFSANPRGGSFDRVQSVGADGVSYSFTVQVCNETRCGGRSPADTATAYGPIRNLNAGNGGSSGTSVTLTVSVNPNGRALNIVVNGTQVATTDGRDGTWSRNFTYDLGGYDRTRTFNVTARDATRSASDSVTLRSDPPPPPPKTVSVSQGSRVFPSNGDCDLSGYCYYIRLSTSGFGGQNYTCTLYGSNGGDHALTSYSLSGNYSGQPGYYYGHWGEQVWAICDGVRSSRVTWNR